MDKLRVFYTPGVSGTYFQGINEAGQYWYTVTPEFEAYNAAHLAQYQIAATGDGNGKYEATIPAEWPAGIYDCPFVDPASSSDALTSVSIDWTGSAIRTLADVETAAESDTPGTTTLLTRVTDVVALSSEIDALQTHGDANWEGGASVTILPVTTTVNTGEVKARRIVAYQHAAFGPFDFTVTDDSKPPQPIDVDGDDISFVVYSPDATGTYLWQIDNCTVSGDDGNIVTVEDDDTNTDTAGDFKYVLRNLTTDKVLAIGELVIVTAADVAAP